jgi:hypothetical protein
LFHPPIPAGVLTNRSTTAVVKTAGRTISIFANRCVIPSTLFTDPMIPPHSIAVSVMAEGKQYRGVISQQKAVTEAILQGVDQKARDEPAPTVGCLPRATADRLQYFFAAYSDGLGDLTDFESILDSTVD